MKRFLVRVLVFFVPAFLLAYPMDFFISNELKKSNSFADGEFPTWNKLYKGTINSNIVVYGSSRAMRQFDPKMLSDSLHTSVFNMGINGHSFYSQYFRHRLLIEHNKKPKVIIQSLDITSFEIESDFYNPDQYLPYMLNNTELANNVHNDYPFIDYRLPLLRYYGKKEALIETLRLVAFPSNNKPVRIRGFKGNDFKWNNDFGDAQSKYGSLKVDPDSSLIVLFDRYLNECTKQNIRVVLVNPPVYIEGQKLVSNWSEIMRIYYNFSRKYGIPILDYAKDSISQNRGYFYNSQHLNTTGAEIFTARLIKDMRKLKGIAN